MGTHMRTLHRGSNQFPLFEPSFKTIVASLGMVLATAFCVAQTLLLGMVVDAITQGAYDRASGLLLLLLCVSAVAGMLTILLGNWVPLKLNLTKEIASTRDLLGMVLKAPQRVFQAFDKGYYINLATNSAMSYGSQWSLVSVMMVGNVLCIVLVLLAALMTHPVYFLLFAIYLPLYWLSVRKPNQVLSSIQGELLPRQDAFLGEIKSTVERKRPINILRADEFFQSRFFDVSESYLQRIVKYKFFETLTTNLPSLLTSILQVLTLGVSIVLLRSHSISLGTMLAAWQISSLLQTPLNGLFEEIIYCRANTKHIERLRDFGESSSHPSGFERLYHPQEDLVRIESGKLFSVPEHEAKEPLFSIRNLVIPRGSLTVVKGKNGTGKSMLLDYLTGFSDVDDFEGEVFCDESVASCAYLTYPIILVDGTLADNLLGECLDERAFEVLGLSEVGDKQISERESNLSFGERQKLGLLRAFSQDADVLVLDEPFSNLDRGTIERLVPYLASMRGEKTVICVMHSSELDAFCDQMLTIEDGELRAEMPGEQGMS